MRSQLRLQTCLVSEDGGKRIQSQGRVALLGRRSRRGPLQRRGRAACGPAERLQGRHTLCFHPEELSVLRRGRRPGPRVLRGDGGDQKRPEEVQAEEDPEESDSTGGCEAGASLHPCGLSHDPL